MRRSDSIPRRLIVATIAALLVAGCSHVRRAHPAAPGVDLDAMNSSLAGRMVVVRLMDNTELIAHDVKVSAESVSLRVQRFPHLESPWPEREHREIPTSDVRSIEVTLRGRGAAQGALIGTGIGIVAGAAIGVAINEADEASIWSNETGALVGSGVFGVLGMGVGVILGVGLGSTVIYDLTQAP